MAAYSQSYALLVQDQYCARSHSSEHEPDPSDERQDVVDKRWDVFKDEVDDKEVNRSSERDAVRFALSLPRRSCLYRSQPRRPRI
jgi:hypothetical protein